jgi:hypothetical protein
MKNMAEITLIAIEIGRERTNYALTFCLDTPDQIPDQ